MTASLNGSCRMTPVVRQRGVGSSWVMGASNQTAGHTHHRMGAWCEAGPLVEQVLDRAARLDRQDIDEGFGERAPEVEPASIRQGTQPRATGDLQIGAANLDIILGRPAAQPGL